MSLINQLYELWISDFVTNKEKLAGGVDAMDEAQMAALREELSVLRRRNAALSQDVEEERKKRLSAEAALKSPWRACTFFDKV